MMLARMLTLFIIIILSLLHPGDSQNQRNVLFIVVDDLRPEFGPYLDTDEAFYPEILTPNLNALAGDSIVMRKAYTQYALCGPSRSSFLTSRRPDTTKVYQNSEYWRTVGGNFTTLPQYFRENNYLAFSGGKIFHLYDTDDQFSWDEPNYGPTTESHWHEDGLSWGIAEPENYTEIPLPCMQTRDYVIEKLQNVSEKEEPFFIAAGFEKPHLPFLAPREFFEFYPEDDIYLPDNPSVPENFPEVAWSGWGGLTRYKDIEEYDNSFNNTLPDFKTLELRRAYYASISYTDSLIGEVLDELERLEMQDNTIVVVMSDHGFHLGENSHWTKDTNYQLDTRVAMMIKVPGMTDGGFESDALVENVDIFPTLVQLAGLEPLNLCPPHSSQVKLCTEGVSMAPLFEAPNRVWKSATFSQVYQDEFDAAGYRAMTPEYVYVRWINFVNNTADWTTLIAEELYDLINDPNQLINVADFEEYEEAQEKMLQILLAGWRAALPLQVL